MTQLLLDYYSGNRKPNFEVFEKAGGSLSQGGVYLEAGRPLSRRGAILGVLVGQEPEARTTTHPRQCHLPMGLHQGPLGPALDGVHCPLVHQWILPELGSLDWEQAGVDCRLLLLWQEHPQ